MDEGRSGSFVCGRLALSQGRCGCIGSGARCCWWSCELERLEPTAEMDCDEAAGQQVTAVGSQPAGKVRVGVVGQIGTAAALCARLPVSDGVSGEPFEPARPPVALG